MVGQHCAGLAGPTIAIQSKPRGPIDWAGQVS